MEEHIIKIYMIISVPNLLHETAHQGNEILTNDGKHSRTNHKGNHVKKKNCVWYI